jgi:DoxX-like protein
MIWTGRVIGGLMALFLLFDAVLHLLKPAPVVEAFARLGYPVSLSVELGALELICIIVYLIPSTNILGAILLTGYLGGATATQLRAGSSTFETLFPIIIGVLIWLAIYLQDKRIRAMIPVRV